LATSVSITYEFDFNLESRKMQAFFKMAGSEQAGLLPDGMGLN